MATHWTAPRPAKPPLLTLPTPKLYLAPLVQLVACPPSPAVAAGAEAAKPQLTQPPALQLHAADGALR